MDKLVAYFANRSLLVNIFSVGLLVAGTLYLLSAKREAFPNISFDWVIITTVYPGATAADVEKHVTTAIEDELREVDGIDEFTSGSQESLSTVAIKLDPDIENKAKVITNIKNAVDRVDSFPADVEEPNVLELETGMLPILEIALRNKNGTSDDAGEFALRRHAKILSDRLRMVDGVARISKRGYRDREMIVEVDPVKLATYQVAMNLVIAKLKGKNVNFPGGVVKGEKGEVLIRTVGEVLTPDDIKRVPVRANISGNFTRIGSLAEVRDSFAEEKIIEKSRGRRAIILTIIKKESADIITLNAAVQKELKRFKETLPKEYELNTYNDMSYYVQRRLRVLVNNGIVGFGLVLLSLFLALGWRISLVTALGLPLAMFGTFIWMGQAGISINMMSMFGLIMVLGMLVDDAIIVAENVYRHREAGLSINEAVIKGTTEVMKPVAGTVMTTIAAFAPLLFMSGIMGKFMWVLPAVVSVALIASWVECMFILPAHIKDVEEKADAAGAKKRRIGTGRFLTLARERYRRILAGALRHRYIFFGAGALFAIGTIAFSAVFVRFVLFPSGGVEIIVVRAEAEPKTGVREMSRRLAGIEKIVASLPKSELDTFTTRAGIRGESSDDPNTIVGTNYGTILVFLTPAQGRKRDAATIQAELTRKARALRGNFKTLEFSPVETGPPVGKAVNISLQGDDRKVLRRISNRIQKHLSGIRGLKNVKDDYFEGKLEYRVYVDERMAEIAGVSVYDVATTIRSVYAGTVATTIKKGDEQIDIRVIFPESLRKGLDGIKRIKVANPRGNLIPLSRVARIETKPGIFSLNRRGGRSAITVTADLDEKVRDVSSVSVNRNLQKNFSGIEKEFPGVVLNYEGEFKDTEESVTELLRSFLIAALVIYILLVWIFRSLAHPLVIMGVIPFTFLGVIWIFFFHGLPISFLALMGVVGLTGVIVNDSIVLVDFIKRERTAGASVLDAALNAGAARLRPVFLTTITTFLGLLPTAYGIGGDDPFIKPMAIALSWGLAFGTLITLLGTPVLYSVFADMKHKLLGKELF